ncbi:MAG: oligopeptide:H+ symporter [Gammaproteobacteria bacterium]|nr:oligopeptide:H+ symporter [Gammaproteobacteria bacterium]
MQAEHSHQKAAYFIIAVVMWEFFSYFGMQALLILYLTHKLHMPDIQAYAIYGGFTSLIFVTPIIGGWLADKYCGYRYAVIWGCLLIIAGHLSLGLNTKGLYIGLSFLILGIGLFKSNAICLIAECYPHNQTAKSAAFVWYYVSGNLGAVASQLLCPYLAHHYDWQIGFMAAAGGMLMGLATLIASPTYFHWYRSHLPQSNWLKLAKPTQTGISLSLIGLSFALVYMVLNKLWVGYLLVFVLLVSAWIFYSIYKQANETQRKSLILIVVLTGFATLFWIFDQQGSSSISLFIDRYIDRHIGNFTVPTGWFQAINPGVILLTGGLMAWGWKALGKRGIRPKPLFKLSIAMLLLALGFLLIAYGADQAYHYQFAAMTYPVLGLALIGSAEVFVDPVLLACITDNAPPHSEGRLIAIYYLAVGAVANYLAAKVADLTIDPDHVQATALAYHQAYMQILAVALFLFTLLVIALKSRKFLKM